MYPYSFLVWKVQNIYKAVICITSRCFLKKDRLIPRQTPSTRRTTHVTSTPSAHATPRVKLIWVKVFSKGVLLVNQQVGPQQGSAAVKCFATRCAKTSCSWNLTGLVSLVDLIVLQRVGTDFPMTSDWGGSWGRNETVFKRGQIRDKLFFDHVQVWLNKDTASCLLPVGWKMLKAAMLY